jgi:hypothetical protein
MPITPFLNGQVFDPEAIAIMGEAFTEACQALGLKDRNDSMTELVAKNIIKLAQRGVRTKTALYLATIKEFKANPQ